MDARIRVFIVDDHPIFRQGLKQVLASEPRLKVAGEAGDGASALDEIKSLKPDVAVVDINLPRLDGLELAQALQRLRPPVPVVVLTMYKEEKMVNAALDAGVKGYVLKDNAATELVNGIKEVAAGGVYLTPAVSGCLLRRSQRAAQLQAQAPGLARLSPMERRVLKLVALNETSRAIGAELFISPRTVETHRANICAKLGLRGSHRLLQFALEHKSEL